MEAKEERDFPPPNICPMWPIDVIGDEYLYIAEFRRTGVACGTEGEAAYLQGVYDWPTFCESGLCEQAPDPVPLVGDRAAKKSRDERSRNPSVFAGLLTGVDDTHDPIEVMPSSIAREYAQAKPVMNGRERIEHVRIRVAETSVVFKVYNLTVESIYASYIDPDTNRRISKEVKIDMVLGKEVQDSNGTSPMDIVDAVPIDRRGKRSSTPTKAYRTRVAERNALLLLKE